MYKLFFSLLAVFMAIENCISVTAQENPVERAKTYPPSSIGFDTRSLEWQMRQAVKSMQKHVDVFNQIENEIAVHEKQISELNNEIAPELRNLDNRVRSQLIGNALEKLLDAKLEIAAIEEMINYLEKDVIQDKNKNDSLVQQELEIERQTAQKRFELAAAEWDKAKILRKNKSLTEQQAERARVSAEIAELEYQKASTRARVEKQRSSAESADALIDKRTSLIPLRIKVKTIEQFLAKLSKSTEVSQSVEREIRSIERLSRNLEMKSDAIFDLTNRINELDTLQKMIASEKGDSK